MTGLLWLWTWTIDIATLSLILESDIIMTTCGFNDDWREIFSRLHKWLLTLFLLFLSKEWKENWFGNKSISLFPGKNSWLKEEKEGMISLNLLSISTIGPLIFWYCLGMSPSNKRQWVLTLSEGLASNSDLIIWFVGRECALSWNLPSSFWILR